MKVAQPRCSRRNPERIRNSHVLPDTAAMPSCAPTTNTIIHEKTRTTIVRIAVATSESVWRIPHFARIDVSPQTAQNQTHRKSTYECLLYDTPFLPRITIMSFNFKSVSFCGRMDKSSRRIKNTVSCCSSCTSPRSFPHIFCPQNLRNLLDVRILDI